MVGLFKVGWIGTPLVARAGAGHCQEMMIESKGIWGKSKGKRWSRQVGTLSLEESSVIAGGTANFNL